MSTQSYVHAKTEVEPTTAGPVRQQPTDLPPPLAGAPLGQGEVVLVLDGVPIERGFVGSVLRQLGYRVLEAAHATEAQSLASAEQNVHLLLLDLSVIDTRHLEFALWFRGAYPKTKVLVVSGCLWELDFRLGAAQQFSLLAKPFTPLELARVVRRTLG